VATLLPKSTANSKISHEAITVERFVRSDDP
jgi:hypothetical protein